MSKAHYIPMIILGNISSLLSIFGSSSVIYMSHKEISYKILYRLLLGVSLADLITSTSSFLMPYLIPMDIPAAMGTQQTCTGVGFFFLTFSFIGSYYSACLGIYYILVVCHGWKEHDFTRRKWSEILLHLLSPVVPLAINLTAVATQSINITPIFNNACVYAAVPWDCGEEGHPECERSSDATISKLFITVAIWECSLSVMSFVCALLVWKKVSKTIKRSSSYRFEGSTGTDEAGAERLRQVGIQAVLYSAAYFNTFLWPIISLIVTQGVSTTNIDDQKTKIGFYMLQILFWTFYPLQGFLNFFIFTRLKVQQWKRAEPNRSIVSIYRMILLSKEPPRKSTRSSYIGDNTIRQQATGTAGATTAKKFDFTNTSTASNPITPFPETGSNIIVDDGEEQHDDEGLIE